MAWALQFDGVNDYLTFPAAIGTGTGVDDDDGQHWELIITQDFLEESTYLYRILQDTVVNRPQLRIRLSDGLFRFVSPISGQYEWTGVPIPNETNVKLTLIKPAGVRALDLYVNDVFFARELGGDNACSFNVYGKEGSAGYFSGNLTSLVFTDFITPANDRNFDPTASSHASGTPVLTDTVGSNDATGVNMPTDGSAWVWDSAGETPWALQFDGVNDHSLLGAAISISTTDDFSLRWRWPADANSGNHRVLGGINLAASSPRVILFSGGNAVLYGDAGTNKSFPASIDTSVDRVVEFRRASGQLGLYYDNVLQGAAQASTQSFTSFSTLGGNFGTSTIASKLQTLEIDVAGSPVIALDATASSHASGTPILTDTIGANNATGVNMPTDGSAWIDLGGGGENNVSSAFNLSALSFAAVIDNPSTGNNVSSAFNLSALSFAAVLDNTPIENNVSSAFNLSPLSFAAVIDNTSTGNSVSSAFNLSPLSFSAVLDNTPIENSVSSAFNLSPLSFAAVIDNSAAGNSVSSAFSLSALQFASVIDNTPIENSVSSAFNLSPLSFAVRVQNGELVAIVIETNSIVQSNYSRTIIQPTYSTNIKGK